MCNCKCYRNCCCQAPSFSELEKLGEGLGRGLFDKIENFLCLLHHKSRRVEKYMECRKYWEKDDFEEIKEDLFEHCGYELRELRELLEKFV